MSKHLKRLAMPRTWTIPRKTHKWAVKPRVGSHPLERSIPLVVVLRDMLGYCDSYKEGRHIIGAGEILIDGRISKDYKRGVGIMDVISIPKINENYRVLLDNRGKIKLSNIPIEKSKWKLARIENKKTIKNGKIQLNLHDGRNIIINKDKFKTGDVIKLEIPEQKVLDVFNLKENFIALIIEGKHVGEIASIKRIEITRSPKPNLVHFDKFSTIKQYVFIVGSSTPEITLLGA